MNHIHWEVKAIKKYEVEWNKKLTMSFACLVFFFIGAPLGAIIRKGGLGTPAVISIFFFVIYYVISISGQKLVEEDVVGTFAGMWAASYILLPIGIFLTYKATTDSVIMNIDTYLVFFKKIKDYIYRISYKSETAENLHLTKYIIKMNDIKLNTIEEAIEDIRKGKILIVVDDEDRENEGDFICSAELITPEIVNFMAKHGRGLICAALPEERCEELELDLMVGINTSIHETQFTVSVDLINEETTTGVSAKDRALTIKALVDPATKPTDLGRPGHIFPLKAKAKGVLRRAGHTEAVVDLTRLAGLSPGGALVEIMNDDGSMARLR